MPIPRKFDRRPPERDQTRINERIRVPEVRLIGEDGNQVGVLATQEALRYAQERELDLVEVAPDSRPPVCRVLDYSKYKYEQEQKAKAARKHQKQVNVREIKLRPKIATNDYETKKGHVMRFLRGQDRVKVTIMFRGREMTHPERGVNLLERLAEDVADLGVVEQRPLQDGRNMTMLLAPVKPKQEQADQAQPDGAQPDQAQPDGAQPDGAQPEQAQPAGTQPENAQPENAQPAGTQPENAQPENEQPAGTQPESAQPEKAQPKKPQPRKAQSRKAGPQKAEPEKAPQAAEPAEAPPQNGGKADAPQQQADAPQQQAATEGA